MCAMSSGQTDANPYRLLPKVDAVLRAPRVAALEEEVGATLLARFVGDVLDEWRAAIAAGEMDAAALATRLEADQLSAAVERKVREERGRGVVRAINAAGVVMHTGLGRSPVHPDVAAAMAAAAAGYCVLEVDRFTGQRNQRDDRLSQLLGRLTGAEAGIAVNNNAAAAFLTMHTFAAGREAIVSRGELVEIGGSFRVPDVMAMAGSRLVEVGTTNRTRIGDYAAAITPQTGLLMKVHRSNFRLQGFIEEVECGELAALGAERGVRSAFDLGSGLVEGPEAGALVGLEGETRVRSAVESGLDVVTVSGDKLCGAPHAGLIAGSARAMQALRKNPLYRALRLDKAAVAGLEATLELYLSGRGDELPTRVMLRRTPEELRARADALVSELAGVEGLTAEVVACAGQPGSGSAPGVELAGFAVRVTRAGSSPDELAASLRAGEPPVFARVQDGALLLDPRSLLPGEDSELVQALRAQS